MFYEIVMGNKMGAKKVKKNLHYIALAKLYPYTRYPNSDCLENLLDSHLYRKLAPPLAS
jgi:hypothetical protein